MSWGERGVVGGFEAWFVAVEYMIAWRIVRVV